MLTTLAYNARLPRAAPAEPIYATAFRRSSGPVLAPSLVWGRMQTIDLDTLDSVVGGGWWEEYVAKPARFVRDTIRENLPYPVGPEQPNPQLPGLPIRLPSSK